MSKQSLFDSNFHVTSVYTTKLKNDRDEPSMSTSVKEMNAKYGRE